MCLPVHCFLSPRVGSPQGKGNVQPTGQEKERVQSSAPQASAEQRNKWCIKSGPQAASTLESGPLLATPAASHSMWSPQQMGQGPHLERETPAHGPCSPKSQACNACPSSLPVGAVNSDGEPDGGDSRSEAR